MTTYEELRNATLADRLRTTRRAKGLTQEQLGAAVGTQQSLIQKIETGKSTRPRRIMELAAALEINPAWLQFGAPYATRQTPER